MRSSYWRLARMKASVRTCRENNCLLYRAGGESEAAGECDSVTKADAGGGEEFAGEELGKAQ